MEDRVLAWDAEIKEDGSEHKGYVILEEGDYDFTVGKKETMNYPGGAKIPACPMVQLTLCVQTADGIADVRCRLFMVESQAWKLGSFFASIGLKKPGEPLKLTKEMWNAIDRKTGRAHFTKRTYTGNDGLQRETNDVKTFYPAKAQSAPAVAPQATATQPKQQKLEELDPMADLPF